MKVDAIHFRKIRFELLALLLAGVLVAAIRIWQLPSYPFAEDELLSISVMASIADGGQPLTEVGLIYWRAMVAHYLMALPLLFLPTTPLSTRMVCVLFSVLSMWIAYAAGRSLGGRVGGWLAFLLLGISSFQNWHAAMARFYMPFQFFFLLTVYLAGVVFIEKKVGAGKWLVAAFIAAIGSHQFALQLFPACLFGVVIGQSWHLCTQRRFLLGAALVLAATALLLFWHPPGTHTGEGALPLLVGGMQDKWAFYSMFKVYFPLGMTLICLSLIPVFLGRQRLLWRYYAVFFIFSLVSLSLVSPAAAPRYMAHLFPLAVIIGTATVGWLIVSLCDKGVYKTKAAIALCVCALLLAGWHLITQERFTFRWAVGTSAKFPDQKPAHDVILLYLRAGDLIMSTEPALTRFYLQRQVDYSLRQDIDPEKDRHFPFAERLKEGNADFFVDSPQRLREVLQSKKTRIFLYGNHKLGWGIGPEMAAIVRSEFIPLYIGKETYAFVTR